MQSKTITAILFFLILFGLVIALAVAWIDLTPAETTPAVTETQETQDVASVPLAADPWVETLRNAPLDEEQYREASADLNGDGTLEIVALAFSGSGVEGVVSTISVNGQSKTVSRSNPQGYFGIVDIDTTDAFKEVAISDLGPSTDYTTAFYRWDGSKIVYLNTTPDLWEHMTFTGDGTFQADARAGVLDTWFYRETYEVTDETIQQVPQDFYARITPAEVTALKPLNFQASITSAVTSMTLAVGEKATVTGCSSINVEDDPWCEIKDTSGNVGWFNAASIDLQNDFEGFSFAD